MVILHVAGEDTREYNTLREGFKKKHIFYPLFGDRGGGVVRIADKEF